MPRFHVVVLTVGTVEMRWLLAGDPEPIPVAVRTSRFSVEAHPTVLTRFEVGVGDAVAFGQRLSRAIHCDIASHCFDRADHFMPEHLGDTALDFRSMSAPKV